MNGFFGNFKKTIPNFFSGAQESFNQDERFSSMSNEELITTASILQEENVKLKDKLREINSDNLLLKNSVLNNSGDSSSQFSRIYNDLKTTFWTNESKSEQTSHLNNFKEFLYNQYLFYGGWEEEDINYLNQWTVVNDEDWEKKKEVFWLRQKIWERNYNELFRNMWISKEFNSYLNGKPVNKNEDKRKDNAVKANMNANKRSEEEGKEKDEDTKYNSNIKELNEENRVNKIKNQVGVNDILAQTLKNSKDEIKNVSDYSDKKVGNISSNSNRKKENEVNLLTHSIQTPSPNKPAQSKKEVKKDIFSSLWLDDDDEDGDEGMSFSKIDKKKKNKWDEE